MAAAPRQASAQGWPARVDPLLAGLLEGFQSPPR